MSYGFKLNGDTAAKSIQQGQLLIPRDKFGDFVGLFLFFCLWLGVIITLHKTNYDFNAGIIIAFIGAGILFTYALYCLARERDLTKLKTGLSTVENKKLLISAFHSLGWYIMQNDKYVVTAAISRKWYGFVQQNATALIHDETIFLNVLHESSMRGRSPFSYGFNAQKLNLLISAINSQLAQEKAQ